MPLILAIEPDRKQAGQLTAMVRGRLHAELVLGDSAEHALDALGQRIPDLVLTSALLSPKDESALGERLRALDGAAAHVQTLTIPVLAAPSRSAASRAGGVLSALRRDKKGSASAPEGCDPAVFADQCKEYLERAAAEREALIEQAASLAARAKETKEPTKAPAAPSPVTGSEWVVVRDEEAAGAQLDAEPIENEFATSPPASPASPASFETPAIETPAAPYDRKAPIYVPYGYAQPTEEAAPVEVAPEPAPVVPQEPPPPAAPRAERKKRSRTRLKEEDSGPASLLAAVAALEAEAQQVQAVESYAIVDEPVVEAAAVDPVAASYADAQDEDDAAAEPSDELDLSSLLQASSLSSSSLSSGTPSNGAREYGGFSEVPADVYELDLTTIGSPLEFQETPAEPQPTLESSTPAARSETRSWPILEDLLEGLTTTSPTPAPAAPAKAAEPENRQQWSDIVEALRRDAEQLQAAPLKPAAAVPEPDPIPLVDALQPNALDQVPVPVTEASTTAEAEATKSDDPAGDGASGQAKRKKKRTRGNPAQDEWGFFDPEQCGFAALIEKLEEITDDDPPPPRRA